MAPGTPNSMPAGVLAERDGAAVVPRANGDGNRARRSDPDQPLPGFDGPGRERRGWPSCRRPASRRWCWNCAPTPAAPLRRACRWPSCSSTKGSWFTRKVRWTNTTGRSRSSAEPGAVAGGGAGGPGHGQCGRGRGRRPEGAHRQGNTLIVGQTTFGKGSIQGVIPLDKAPLDKTPGGIRITVAKLFSPGKHQPYTGRGVTPDILVYRQGRRRRAGGRLPGGRAAARSSPTA